MSEWQQTTLGAVMTEVSRPVSVKELTEARYAGVRWYAGGVYHRDTVPAEKIKGKTLYRIEHDDIVYNRMWATKASFGVVKTDTDDCLVTNDFPVFTADPEAILPEYVEAIFHTTSFQSEAASRAAGTTERRRLHVRDFARIPILLPPLPMQERIVEIIGAVDDQIAKLDAEATATRKLLDMTLAEHFAAVEGESHRIVDLCSHVVGGVWGEPEGEGEVDRLALGPRIYSPGTSGFVTDGSPVRSFTTKQASTRTVQEQDIILERSGGSPEQPVGRVVIAGPDLEPCVPTDFQRLIRIDPEKASAQYVFWRLRHDWSSGLTRNYSRRTTGITNLSVKDYIDRQVIVPSRQEQAGLVEIAEAVDVLVVALYAEVASLRQVRAGLLSGLLDQTINIESAELEV